MRMEFERVPRLMYLKSHSASWSDKPRGAETKCDVLKIGRSEDSLG